MKVRFDFSRQSVAVKQYYFYVQDRDWGPAFVKIGTYLPYPVKLCLNGHEWVKQQLRREMYLTAFGVEEARKLAVESDPAPRKPAPSSTARRSAFG